MENTMMKDEKVKTAVAALAQLSIAVERLEAAIHELRRARAAEDGLDGLRERSEKNDLA